MSLWNQNKEQSNINKTYSPAQQSLNLGIDEQNEHPKTHLDHVDTEASCNIVSPIPLTESEALLPTDSLKKPQENDLVSSDEICSDHNSFPTAEQNICEQSSQKIDIQQNNLMTAQQPGVKIQASESSDFSEQIMACTSLMEKLNNTPDYKADFNYSDSVLDSPPCHANLAPFHANLAPFHANLAPCHENLAPCRANPASFRANPAPFHANLAPCHANPASFRANPAPFHANLAPCHANPAPCHANPASFHANLAPFHENFGSTELPIQQYTKASFRNALYLAVDEQQVEYLKFLLFRLQEKVINLKAEEPDILNRLLMYAVKGGNLEIIKQVLYAGADINYENFAGDIPLAESRNDVVARFLISRGANVNKVTRNRKSPLILILLNRYISPHSSGFQLVDVNIVKTLLENGASVNHSGPDGRTALMITAWRESNISMLQILLDYGADLNIQDEEGKTAIMYAVVGNCRQNISFLFDFAMWCKKDIHINIQDNNGFTALTYAINYNHYEVLKQLVGFNADVNIKRDGGSALFYAVTARHTPTDNLRTLVRAGCDVNCYNDDGMTPLMQASYMCWKEGMLVLLSLGAYVDALHKKKLLLTALTLLGNGECEETEMRPCLQALLMNGASSSYGNKDLIYKLIYSDQYDLIPELIQSGMGPIYYGVEDTLPIFLTDNALLPMSPLSAALFVGNVLLAEYFVKILFLTIFDINFLVHNKTFREILKIKYYNNCLDLLEKMSSRPMSLFELAFVEVLSAVGTFPGREGRVDALPLPQSMKDRLLFKSRDVLQETARAKVELLHLSSSSKCVIQPDLHNTSRFFIKAQMFTVAATTHMLDRHNPHSSGDQEFDPDEGFTSRYHGDPERRLSTNTLINSLARTREVQNMDMWQDTRRALRRV